MTVSAVLNRLGKNQKTVDQFLVNHMFDFTGGFSRLLAGLLKYILEKILKNAVPPGDSLRKRFSGLGQQYRQIRPVDDVP